MPPMPRWPASWLRCAPRAKRCEELTGLVEAMIANARPLDVAGEHLDIVGTGGDRQNTVNISTMASLVCAGAGATDRQARQPCLVVVLGLGGRARGAGCAAGCARSTDCMTCWMPPTSPSASPTSSIPPCATPPCPRRELGVPTAFNFMGPLTNPSEPTASAIGCADLRHGAAHGRGTGRTRRSCAGVPRRGRPGRADDHRCTTAYGRSATGRSPNRRSTPGISAWPGPRSMTCAAETPCTTPGGARRARWSPRAGPRRRPAQRRRRAGGLRRRTADGIPAGPLGQGRPSCSRFHRFGGRARVLEKWIQATA